MGKGARNRKRHSHRATEVETTGSFFHGGVPGKRPGDVLQPATDLGIRFTYNTLGRQEPPYDPRWVYIATDPDVATAYASRYLEPDGRDIPGDVYEVEPLDPLHGDPDYSNFPTVFRRCRRARITRVVNTSVVLTRVEQNYLERHYQVWGQIGFPVWDKDGFIIPSEQMAANGVTREWTTMLRPWLGPAEVDPEGRLEIVARSATPWQTMLEAVPALDRDCHMQPHPLLQDTYQCAQCGHQPHTQSAAALHQLGEYAVELVTRIHRWEQPPIPPLATAAQQRNPARWQWLTPPATN